MCIRDRCAGFLRVPESKQVLDRTGVHPESYDAAKKLAELLDIDLKTAGKPEMANLPDKLRAYGAEKAAACLLYTSRSVQFHAALRTGAAAAARAVQNFYRDKRQHGDSDAPHRRQRHGAVV